MLTNSKFENTIGDFLILLQQTADAEECGQHLINLYQSLGAQATNIWCGYDVDGKVAGNYPEEWRQFIYEKGWAKKQYVCLLSKQSMDPIFWGIDISPQDPRHNEQGLKVIETAHEAFDVGCGVTFPVHSYQGELDGGISYTTSLPTKEFQLLMQENLIVLQSAAIMTHLHIQFFLRPSKTATQDKLSSREKECVIWLAKGFRTQQIAEKLGLKEVSIYLYLQNAKRKLQANTREQLVVKALVDNHINL